MSESQVKVCENERAVDEFVLLASGVDTLCLFLDCGALIDWKSIVEQIEYYDYDQSFSLKGLSCVREKAWMKAYPVCLRIGQFLFFVNRQSAYIKFLALGFEMRGFDGMQQWLCKILDCLRAFPEKCVPWLEFLKVSRLDVFTDFAFDGEFHHEQFRTKLKKSGYFQSGENAEGKTLYFGSRASMLARLYVKSVEIEVSGKTYLREAWREKACGERRIWRLEFEFHKAKLEEIIGFREYVAYDENAVKQLHAYGVNSFEYCTETATNRNLSKAPLHPLWRALQTAHCSEYCINRKQVEQANIAYRYKMARKWVISWLAASSASYDDLPMQYLRDFKITVADYQKAVSLLPLSLESADRDDSHQQVEHDQ